MAEDKRNERREYFRIDDRVHLELRNLSDEEYTAGLQAASEREELEPRNLALMLHHLTSKAGTLLSHIRKSQPEIAQYLQLLDRKIDLLARASGAEDEDLHSPNMRVDLSAGGLGFRSSHAYPLGSKLEIRLTLFPSRTYIHCFGEVIHCQEQPEAVKAPYQIGVEFTEISELAEEALMRHTLELQSTRLRESRQKQ